MSEDQSKPKRTAPKPKATTSRNPAPQAQNADNGMLTALGVGAAIGSAAVAAALLYTSYNRTKKNAEPVAPQDAEPTD
jgi:hypothetical protein